MFRPDLAVLHCWFKFRPDLAVLHCLFMFKPNLAVLHSLFMFRPDLAELHCLFMFRPDLAVLQTPNYPNLFPMTSSCHWRVRPAEFQTSLIIIPSISLPQLCTHTLNIRSQGIQHNYKL